MVVHSHSARRGGVVLQSEPDPDKVFKDISMQRERHPDDEVEWSPLLDHDEFLSVLDSVAPGDEPEVTPIGTILAALNEVFGAYPGIASPMAEDTFNMLPLLTIYGRFPGVEDGMYVSIDEDPFVIYRFESSELAQRYVAEDEDKAFVVDRYVFRSIPINQYKYPRFGVYDRPRDKVDWSELLEDDELIDSRDMPCLGLKYFNPRHDGNKEITVNYTLYYSSMRYHVWPCCGIKGSRMLGKVLRTRSAKM